jgi:hypothetical protein
MVRKLNLFMQILDMLKQMRSLVTKSFLFDCLHGPKYLGGILSNITHLFITLRAIC